MYCKKSFLSLFLNLISFASSYQFYNTTKFSECSSTHILCGPNNITISYPFRLKRMPYYCGHPKFQVQCIQNDTLQIDIAGKPYKVTNIIYDIQYLGVINENYLMSESCPRTYSNFSLDYSLYKYSVISINITLFLSCSRPPPDLNLTHMPCSTNTDGIKESYYSLSQSDDNLSVFEYAKTCKSIVSFPIYVKDVVYLANNFVQVLRKGFGLGWIVGNGWCGDCVRSGGVCGNDPKVPREQACFYRGDSKGKKKILVAVIAVVSSLGGGLLFGTCMILLLHVSRRRELKASTLSLRTNPREAGICYITHIFSYDELEEATHGFHESRELGHGGFGTVYKGKLRDGRIVAVKRLHERNRGLEQFTNEIEILSRLRHQNLVTLYGCTSHDSRERLLVYEYIPNGTLADHLHGSFALRRRLPWPTRMSIIIQTAEALSYLHSTEPPIIHRDIKSNNILLDYNFQVKVADFGISRLFPVNATHVSTGPQGTFGYLDPEYYRRMQLTDRSDVYSFGVVMIELISSKTAVDTRRNTDETSLANMAVTKIGACRIEELVGPDLGYKDSLEIRERINHVAQLAFRCLQLNAESRPSIREALAVLKRVNGEVDAEGVGCDEVKVESSPLLSHVRGFSSDLIITGR